MRARSEANKHGMLRSSRTDLGVKGAYEETYDDICKDAWSELHHIAVTVGVKPIEGPVDELRAVFDEVMKPLAERLFTANMRRAPRCAILRPKVLHRFPKATRPPAGIGANPASTSSVPSRQPPIDPLALSGDRTAVSRSTWPQSGSVGRLRGGLSANRSSRSPLKAFDFEASHFLRRRSRKPTYSCPPLRNRRRESCSRTEILVCWLFLPRLAATAIRQGKKRRRFRASRGIWDFEPDNRRPARAIPLHRRCRRRALSRRTEL